ncbi:MAG: response regulator [Actinomycetales bacterium]
MSDSHPSLPPDSEVRVLVVDDDPLVRDAYRAFLANAPGYLLCGEARNGAEGVQAFATLAPDVVLMDLQMPEMSGVDATREICSRWPQACVVALTTFGTREYVTAALASGASGYLLKDAGGRALMVGMRQALAGEMPLSSAVRRELVSTVVTTALPAREAVEVGLTGRERELLQWLAQGLTNHQIGSQMYVSEGSVKQYLSHVGSKLNAKSRTQILVKALQLGLVDLDRIPLERQDVVER